MGPRQRRNTLLAITRRACCPDANLPVELDGRSFFTNVSLSFKTGHYECLAPMTRDNRELTGESATKLTLKLEAAYCLLQPLKQSCKGCHIELQYPSISYPVDSSNITLLLSHHISKYLSTSLLPCAELQTRTYKIQQASLHARSMPWTNGSKAAKKEETRPVGGWML